MNFTFVTASPPIGSLRIHSCHLEKCRLATKLYAVTSGQPENFESHVNHWCVCAIELIRWRHRNVKYPLLEIPNISILPLIQPNIWTQSQKLISIQQWKQVFRRLSCHFCSITHCFRQIEYGKELGPQLCKPNKQTFQSLSNGASQSISRPHQWIELCKSRLTEK